MIPVQSHPEGATFPVRAQPGAKTNGIIGEQAGALKLSVTAPPEDGRANAAIIELLKDVLGVKRSQIELVAGSTNRNKVMLVRGLSSEALSERLRQLLAERE